MSERSSGLDVRIELTLKDVQKVLCKKCKQELRKLVREQVKDRMADRVVSKILD